VGEELLLYGEEGGDVPRLGLLHGDALGLEGPLGRRRFLLGPAPHLVLLVDPPGRGDRRDQEDEAGLRVLGQKLLELGGELRALGRAVGHHQVPGHAAPPFPVSSVALDFVLSFQ